MLGQPAASAALAGAVTTLSQLVLALLGGGSADGFERAGSEADVGDRRARRAVWRVRRAYQDVVAERSLEDVMAEIKALAPTAQEVSHAAQLWTDVIDSLMESAEKRYGPQAAGEFKKVRVKGALLRWFRRADIDLPGIPQPLAPLILERAVDWSIEIVYAVVAPNDLWAGEVLAARRKIPWWRRVLLRIQAALLRRTRFSNWLTRSIWRGVVGRYPLPAELLPVVAAAADRTQYIEDVVLAQGRQLGAWASEHQRDLAALAHLVSVAVQEAEGFLEASGPEKKGYARGLVLEALEEAGAPLKSGFLRGLAVMLIDAGIDASVNLFHKHDRFAHRTEPAKPAGRTTAIARRAGYAPSARSRGSAVGEPYAVATSERYTTIGVAPVRRASAFPAAGSPANATGPLFATHAQITAVGWNIVQDHLALFGDAVTSSLASGREQPRRHRQY